MFGTRPLFASPVHQGGPGKNVPQPPPNTPVQDQLSAGKKGVPVRYLRNVGAGRNVPVPVLLGGVTAFMAYGWWNYGTSVIADREVKEEEHLVRVAITPFLQAEQDYRYILREDEFHRWEAETMKDVKGYKAGQSVYHSEKRWQPPATDTMPRFS